MPSKPNLTAKLRLSGLGSHLRVKSRSCSHRGTGVVPSTHVATHDYLELSFQGSGALWPLKVPGMYMLHIYVYRQNTHRHKVKLHHRYCKKGTLKN